MSKTNHQTTQGPVGRRTLLLLSNAVKVVTIVHPKSGPLVIIRPTGVGWANVWLSESPRRSNR